jgi:hypothetical protein
LKFLIDDTFLTARTAVTHQNLTPPLTIAAAVTVVVPLIKATTIAIAKSFAADAVGRAHPTTLEALEEEQQEEAQALGKGKP